MNNLEIIEQRELLGKEFKIYGDYENPLFLAKDVAEWIDYDKSSINKMLESIDEEEKLNGTIFRAGQNRDMWFLTEDGLYEVLMQSRKLIAKEFKKEVKKILKSIRKNGGYISNQDNLSNEELLSKALIVAQNVISEKDKLNQELKTKNSYLIVENQIMKPKADYFDELVARNLLTNFRETAQLLGLKEKAFIQFLLDKKFVYRGKSNKLLPYANKNTGLFEIKELVNEKSGWVGTQTLITPKGRETFKLLCS